jgi:negative regulator of sigma E activity
MKPVNEGHDAELSARLRETLPDPPHDAVDWARLHGRIMMDASPLLAAGRVTRPGVWQTLSSWGSRAIPLTAAAAAAVALVLGYGPERPGAAAAESAEFRTVEEALAAELPSGSAPLLIAGATDDELFDALLFYDEGDRP